MKKPEEVLLSTTGIKYRKSWKRREKKLGMIVKKKIGRK